MEFYIEGKHVIQKRMSFTCHGQVDEAHIIAHAEPETTVTFRGGPYKRVHVSRKYLHCYDVHNHKKKKKKPRVEGRKI